MEMLLVLGNQLFAPQLWPKELASTKLVFMREDRELCTYFKFHKHKIIFFLAAMRSHCESLEAAGLKVHYESLEMSQSPYEDHLKKFIHANQVKTVFCFEIEDKFFAQRISSAIDATGAKLIILPSPMFLTSRSDFKSYLSSSKKPFMKTFYEGQRKRLKILVDGQGKAKGGQWSFDDENRLPLPKNILPPGLPTVLETKHMREVKKLCELHFADHPGDVDSFWLPVTRSAALDWLKNFVTARLENFGPYEDALAEHSDFVFHSVLSPFLNCGLLTPAEVIAETLKFYQKENMHLPSVEGFIRQIIGWREFIRGIYQNYSEQQDKENYFNHQRKLSKVWYEGGSTVPQLERTLTKVFTFAYCHHIERLMVIGNLMLLLEVHPPAAHAWFMEMFVDSADWVMGPNVYGMALFSDGGIFATKPYICGSNYWRKMSKEKPGPWCDGVDGLYWQFIDKHRTYFSKNPRLSMMVRSFDKIPEARKKTIFAAANQLRAELTTQ